MVDQGADTGSGCRGVAIRAEGASNPVQDGAPQRIHSEGDVQRTPRRDLTHGHLPRD